MRKIFMLMAAVAMLAGCSKDLTTDLTQDVNGSENFEGVNSGITVELSVDDITRVTVEGDEAGQSSYLYWEVGDLVTLVYDGKSYEYVATTVGRTTDFVAKDEANALYPTDLTKPVAAFYNVESVDEGNMTAVFNVAAEQTVGQLTNKLPLYGYSQTTVVENGKLVLKMNPLASVVDFELQAPKAWNVDALSLEVSALQEGTYAVASGVVVDATTGALNLDTAEIVNQVLVNLGQTVDLATAHNVQAVVMGLTREVTVKETVTNEDQTTTEVEKTELYAPVYHGKAVVKLFKNGAENVRRTIWSKYSPGQTAVDERKHIYQPMSNVLKEKVADGISTAEQMKAFADAVNGTTELYPTGAEFSNEDGVVVLKNNIDLSAYSNWIAIGCNNDESQIVKSQFTGIFDGNNNTISGLTVDHNKESHIISYPDGEGGTVASTQNGAGLFGVVAKGGVVKNLTVSGAITVNMTHPKNSWTYIGGVVAQISGGTIENCTSKVAISGGASASGKARVGGIIGRLYASSGDITVKNCKNEGTINVSYPAGVTGQSVVGGVVAMLSDGSAGCIPTVQDCSNSASITCFNGGMDTYVGGVFGYITRNEEKLSIITNCNNTGAVCGGSTETSCTAIHIGGIAGRQNCHTLYNCTNEGAVSLSANTTSPLTCDVGGVIGVANGGANNVARAEKCVNKGTVTVKGVDTISGGLCIGGFIGYARFYLELSECQNIGEVLSNAEESNTQTHAGAFAGKVGVDGKGKNKGIWFDYCINSGHIKLYSSKIHTGWQYGGGLCGSCYGGTDITADGVYGVHLTNCENKGVVSVLGGAKFRAGGIAGVNKCAAFYNCTHSGVIAMERKCVAAEFLGGIVGQLENQYSIIDDCVNSGTVCSLFKTVRETGESTSNIYVLLGGIIGNGGGAKALVTNCESKGKLLAAHDGTLEYDDTAKNWQINLDTTVEYRATIAGNPNVDLPIKNCKSGGYVGVVKGGDGEDKYDASVLHKLNNTEGDTYYWYRWMHGYNVIPKYSGCTFVNVD